MVRPRTQRRRPAATLRVLERLAKELGEQAHVTTFGGSEEELEQFLGRSPQIEHRGILSRERVADLLRQSHLFLDLSTYQAFGRSGFEAMACGCVPVLPVLGGAQEYAEDGVNALLLDVRNDDAVVDAVGRLVLDRDALRMLRREGIRTGERFSIERAALSIYALFAHALIADPG
jgi:glycosyltransferase involved in cell wall biosynthesis